MSNSGPVTILRAGSEEIEPNHWVVFIFDLLGCSSSGRAEQDALAQAPLRVREYFQWLARKDGNPAPFDEPVEITVIEQVRMRSLPGKPESQLHGFFEYDRRPLRLWDIDMIQRLLEWNREDLLAVVASASPGRMEQPVEGLVWKTPRGLLEHIYGAEQWLLGHLGFALEREELPRGTMERLQAIRARTLQIIPELAEVDQVRDIDGELWSPRKMVRRILWHERDHTRQLEELLAVKTL